MSTGYGRFAAKHFSPNNKNYPMYYWDASQMRGEIVLCLDNDLCRIMPLTIPEALKCYHALALALNHVGEEV